MQRTRAKVAAEQREYSNDALSAKMINDATSKNRSGAHKSATKHAPTSTHSKKAIHKPYILKPSIHKEDARDSEDEGEGVRVQGNQSGLEPENMTAELETRQPKSPILRKGRGRPPKKGRQTDQSKGKEKAQVFSEPQNASPQKRKLPADIYEVPVSSEDEVAKQNPNISPAKKRRGPGRPPKNPRKAIVENGPVAPVNNESREEDEDSDSDADLVHPADIGKAGPASSQQLQEDDESDQESYVAEDDDEADGQHDGEGVTGVLLPPTPAKAKLPESRAQHFKSAAIARSVSSNHANGIHNNRNRPSPSRSRRREEVVGEEPGEAADDVLEELEEDEDDQELSRKLALWSGIIDPNFFHKVQSISKRLGCQQNLEENTWDIVIPMDRGVKTNSGKLMEKSLTELRENYRDLEHAIDEEDETSQTKANLDIDKTTNDLEKMVGNILQPLQGNVAPYYQTRRRKFLRDLYIVLVRKFLTVLKIAVLTYGKYDLLSNKGLLVVIKITKIILDLFENIDKQKKELQPKDCGQTKLPLIKLRPLLRNELLKSCEKEVGERRRARERARIRRIQRAQQEEDDRREAGDKEKARREQQSIDEYNRGRQASAMNDPTLGPLIKHAMERVEYQKLPQSERVKLELDAKRAKRAQKSRRQITGEEAVMSGAVITSGRSSYSADDIGSDDPFSENYVPKQGIFSQYRKKSHTARALSPSRSPSPQQGVFSQYRKRYNAARALSLSPSPSPSSSPEPEPELAAASIGPVRFGDIPDEEKQNFYDHFKEKFKYEEQGFEDEEFWDRLQRNLEGGRYTLDEIFGFARELQECLDDAHDNGELREIKHLWTYHVWDSNGNSG
ncbi:hypothetical protein NHQ30_005907 [Ciborinia camelliae]|nr:hypothetical protein NHQ30_005907 [Ciborinia camelliae]